MKCSNCNENIDDDDQIVEAISANRMKKFCHLRCFRCNICQQSLIAWDFEKDGVLYCAEDYYDKFGERCRHCNHFMTGPVMVMNGGEYKFHPECFKCDCCQSIIGDDESYSYVDCRQLFCNNCFQKQTSFDHPIVNRPLTNDEDNGEIHLKHDTNNVIQIIDIPPLFNGRKRRIRLAFKDCQQQHHQQQQNGHHSHHILHYIGHHSTLTNEIREKSDSMVAISEIDVNYDDNHLFHIADRILKINDSFLGDSTTLEDIKNLFDLYCNQIIQLYVEHNPNHDKKIRNSLAEEKTPSPSRLEYNSVTDQTTTNTNNTTNGVIDFDDNNQSKRVVNLSTTTNNNHHHVMSFNQNNDNDNNKSTNYMTSDRPKSLCHQHSNLLDGTVNVSAIDCNSNSNEISNNKSKFTSGHSNSRSSDKRYRNRERSSSLSRLLEAISLNSDSGKNTNGNNTSVGGGVIGNDTCDNLPTIPNPYSSKNNQQQQQHSYFTSSSSSSSRNGLTLASRLNNPLSRTKSFRVEPKSYRIFRASDLVKGALLGKGFYGEVFEVTDKVTKEKMVIKELYHNDREAETNFVREVSILKSLNHKNVLHFIGILYRGKKLNLITEYITGGTLRQLIQDEKRSIYWPERIGWARDIASGVNYLHSMNLIHRDLNSQNCLVREDGTVVVADFGLSKITCSNDDKQIINNNNDDNKQSINNNNHNNHEESFNDKQIQKLNRRRDRRKRYTIVGHPFWMAPEMMHRDKYDERVDIYSFGIILLEIIGSVNADPDVLKRNRDFSVDKKYFFDTYVDKSCPEVFWRIAFLCTELNPDMRPSSQILERWFQLLHMAVNTNHHHCSIIGSSSPDNNNEIRRLTLDELAKEVANHNHHETMNNYYQQQPQQSLATNSPSSSTKISTNL
ncbi:LIM domain kinase 1 isoform X2 [Dermatophagoides pteronyssinus]